MVRRKESPCTRPACAEVPHRQPVVAPRLLDLLALGWDQDGVAEVANIVPAQEVGTATSAPEDVRSLHRRVPVHGLRLHHDFIAAVRRCVGLQHLQVRENGAVDIRAHDLHDHADLLLRLHDRLPDVLDANGRVPANLPRLPNSQLHRLPVASGHPNSRVPVLRQVRLHLGVQRGLVEAEQFGKDIRAFPGRVYRRFGLEIFRTHCLDAVR